MNCQKTAWDQARFSSLVQRFGVARCVWGWLGEDGGGWVRMAHFLGPRGHHMLGECSSMWLYTAHIYTPHAHTPHTYIPHIHIHHTHESKPVPRQNLLKSNVSINFCHSNWTKLIGSIWNMYVKSVSTKLILTNLIVKTILIFPTQVGTASLNLLNVTCWNVFLSSPCIWTNI